MLVILNEVIKDIEIAGLDFIINIDTIILFIKKVIHDKNFNNSLMDNFNKFQNSNASELMWKNIKDDQKSSFKSKLLLTSSLLGILQSDPSNWLKLDGDLSSIDSKKVEKLIAERMIAKEVKDFEKADQIRDELDAMGVIIKDSSSGSEWTLKK